MMSHRLPGRSIIFTTLLIQNLYLLGQSYRQVNVRDIETYFLSETDEWKCVAKKMKRFNTITYVLDTELVTTTVATGRFLITPLTIDVEVPLEFSPKGSSVLFLISMTII